MNGAIYRLLCCSETIVSSCYQETAGDNIPLFRQ